jgi:hypothetical protein
MSLSELFQYIEDTGVGTAIRTNELLFPLIECIHVLAITCVVGSIAFVDLRLIGLGAARKSISATMDDVLPVTRWAFAGAILTGALLFSSHATTYVTNKAFLLKMALLTVALINIVLFHRVTARHISVWDSATTTPAAVKLAGGSSLVLWIAIVAAGRWIGFL